MAELLYSAIRFLPVYPSKAAIEYGFTDKMPVMGSSTSTYPYAGPSTPPFSAITITIPSFPRPTARATSPTSGLSAGRWTCSSPPPGPLRS